MASFELPAACGREMQKRTLRSLVGAYLPSAHLHAAAADLAGLVMYKGCKGQSRGSLAGRHAQNPASQQWSGAEVGGGWHMLPAPQSCMLVGKA